MNQRTAKRLRQQAKMVLYAWYSSLLDEDQQKELTLDLALQYTPVVRYWDEYHERTDDRTGREYVAQQRHVSEGTLRWFILQEKKRNARRYIPSPSNWELV